MLNLREQMVKAGMVSEQAAKRAMERPAKPKRAQENQYVRQLRGCSKNEQYQKIAKWVKINRLDRSTDLAKAQKFYFGSQDGRAAWLTVDEISISALQSGEAVIMAFMSNQGLAHAVMPKEIARDVAVIFPDWIRASGAA